MRLAEALGLGGSEHVAFVGAGGKKTAMGRLATEGTRRGVAVGYTTTTAMPPPADLPLVVGDLGVDDDDGARTDECDDGDDDARPSPLADRDPPVAFAREWVSDPARADRKVRGFDPGVVDDLFAAGRFDWLLVKADGARRREFKAPGDAEPVVPRSATHVVPVASVRAVGDPLTEATVHRPERVAALSGAAVGDRITPETVGAVLASPDGGCRGVPPGATVTPAVNKADTAALRETAVAALDHALARTDRFDRGLVTSFETGVCETVDRGPDG
jgi:probable selenium-dependent hydroxylase accessory protein YqeC